MRLPATERQMFIARHMSPYAPSYVIHQRGTALMYRQAAENLLQALLTGNFSKSAVQLSKAALKAEASAAAAVSGAQQGSGDSVGRDEVLPARTALVEDLDAQFEAGLRPKHTWLVIRGDELLLDLMSGSYLWLKPVQAEVPAAAAAAEDGPAAAGFAAGNAETAAAVVGDCLEAAAAAAAATAEGGVAAHVHDAAEQHNAGLIEAASPAAAEVQPVRRGRGRPRKVSSSDVERDGGDPSAAAAGRSSAAAAAAAAKKQLDPSALYELFLELPDGSMHAVPTSSTATALLAAFGASRTLAAAAGSSSSSSSSRSAKPLPLPAALIKAERLAALLVTQQQAFLSREAAVRLAGMVGGWKVPSLASEQHMAMPASECGVL
jgi:hypothetical protein